MSDPIDRMAAGYGAPSTDSPLAQKARRKQAEAARLHVEDPAMELLLQWKAAGDPRYAALDPHLKMMVAYYQRGKEAAQETDR